MQVEDHETPIIWSAATCDFRGAGVYVGLAPEYEHMAVARGIGARQMQVYAGGRMRSAGEHRPWCIHYYAVRDPQAVRVIPEHQPALPNGFKPVQLRFRFRPNNGGKATCVFPPRNGNLPLGHPMAAAPVGFILTVGLPIEREREFYEHTIERHLDQNWDEVFRRVETFGRKGAA
jgi:hypothetical protein